MAREIPPHVNRIFLVSIDHIASLTNPEFPRLIGDSSGVHLCGFADSGCFLAVSFASPSLVLPRSHGGSKSARPIFP